MRFGGKFFADLLTLSRVFLSLGLAILGITLGAEGLPLAILIVIICWITDLLDGPLARRDPDTPSSWIGEHEDIADMAISLGVTAYLVFSGFLVPWVGIVLAVLLVGLWVFYSHQLAWPIYAIPYVILAIVAYREAPLFFWVVIGYLLILLISRWPRMKREHLPELIEAINRLLGREK